MKNSIRPYLKLFLFMFLSIVFLVETRTLLSPEPRKQVATPQSQPLDSLVLPSAAPPAKAPFVRWMDSLEPGPWFKNMPRGYLLVTFCLSLMFSLTLYFINVFKTKNSAAPNERNKTQDSESVGGDTGSETNWLG